MAAKAVGLEARGLIVTIEWSLRVLKPVGVIERLP